MDESTVQTRRNDPKPQLLTAALKPNHHMSLVVRKLVFGGSNKAPHKPGCTTTQDGLRLEISYIVTVAGLYYLCSENKGADQLRGYREADLRLCFRIRKKPVFSRRGSYLTM